MSEWITFRVGTPSTRQNWSNPDCTPFHAVYHVSHIIPSLSILQNKKIHAGLVFDESKLNKDRLLVSWVSPNHWSPGSRYGTVQFCFDLRQLIQGKNYYWVESIAYGVRACRILVTPNEHKGLAQYDPTVGDGPWWYDKDKDEHYFNGNYCLELMLEEDLAIDAETTLTRGQ